VVRNKDSDFEKEIEVFSYPQPGVVTGNDWTPEIVALELI
jgi:hypothetical protein